MPITRTYGPSAGLVADMAYEGGQNQQSQDYLMQMLQLLSGVSAQNTQAKQQEANLAEQQRQFDQSSRLQGMQMIANNPNKFSVATRTYGNGVQETRPWTYEELLAGFANPSYSSGR